MKKIFFVFGLICFYSVCAVAEEVVATYDVAAVSYVNKIVANKADNNAVVHLSGAETIGGDKTFTGAVVAAAPTDSGDANQVATVDWTKNKITEKLGVVPYGGESSSELAKIWIAE